MTRMLMGVAVVANEMGLGVLLRRFPMTNRVTEDGSLEQVPPVVRPIVEAMSGVTLDSGFYRFHTTSSANMSTQRCAELIGGFADRYFCFAFDWLGREMAVRMTSVNDQAKVIVVDPGAGEYLDPSMMLGDWHDALASDDDPIAYSFYLEWRSLHPAVGELGFNDVVGYKVPLFLGGEDEVSNLEVCDREVYFEICTQLARGVKHLPEGQTVQLLIEQSAASE